MAYTKVLVKSIGLSAGVDLRTYNIQPDGTDGSITVADCSAVFLLSCQISQKHSGGTDVMLVQATENATTTNKIDFYMYQSSNVTATAWRQFKVALIAKG